MRIRDGGGSVNLPAYHKTGILKAGFEAVGKVYKVDVFRAVRLCLDVVFAYGVASPDLELVGEETGLIHNLTDAVIGRFKHGLVPLGTFPCGEDESASTALWVAVFGCVDDTPFGIVSSVVQAS